MSNEELQSEIEQLKAERNRLTSLLSTIHRDLVKSLEDDTIMITVLGVVATIQREV